MDRTTTIQMHARYGITGDNKRKPKNSVKLHKLYDRTNPQGHPTTIGKMTYRVV
jgi:hypothetical protein